VIITCVIIIVVKGKTEYVKEENVYFSERYSGEFIRTIEIPKTVDSDNTKAKLHNGILTVIMPKQEKDLTKIIKVEKNA
jgi:HSP20 family protein